MMPSPTELNYFLEIANTLNISRAAERLGISQPTLSLAIQRLESSLRIALLIRTKSGVRLTQAGQKLVVQTRVLLNEWEKIQSDTVKDESEIRGRYVIGSHISVALYSLSSFLPDLIRNNPNLDVKLVHDLSRRITEDVISFKVDFGIVVNPWEHPDLVIKLLFHDVVSLWVGPKSSPTQNSDSGEGVLLCEPELIQTHTLIKQMEMRGMIFRRTVTSSSLEVITLLVAHGAGVGILPCRVATRVKSMGLKLLDKDAPKFNDRICLVYRSDAQRSKASRTIAKLIEKHLKPEIP